MPNAAIAASNRSEPVLAQAQVEIGPEVLRAPIQAEPELLGGRLGTAPRGAGSGRGRSDRRRSRGTGSSSGGDSAPAEPLGQGASQAVDGEARSAGGAGLLEDRQGLLLARPAPRRRGASRVSTSAQMATSSSRSARIWSSMRRSGSGADSRASSRSRSSQMVRTRPEQRLGLGPGGRVDAVAEADLLGEVVQRLGPLPAMGDAELLVQGPARQAGAEREHRRAIEAAAEGELRVRVSAGVAESPALLEVGAGRRARAGRRVRRTPGRSPPRRRTDAIADRRPAAQRRAARARRRHFRQRSRRLRFGTPRSGWCSRCRRRSSASAAASGYRSDGPDGQAPGEDVLEADAHLGVAPAQGGSPPVPDAGAGPPRASRSSSPSA